MYEAVTSDIRVKVTPVYVEERSSPESGDYFWAYTVEVSNEGHVAVQLVSRQWLIIDGRGKREVVRGPGVVGQTPVIAPGQSFTYTSGCPLGTPSGIMSGSYQMRRTDGAMLDIAIPAFSLDSPDAARSLN